MQRYKERDLTSFPGPSSSRPPERLGVGEDPRDEVSFPVLLYIQEISFCIIFFKSFVIYKSVINQESFFRLKAIYFGIFILIWFNILWTNKALFIILWSKALYNFKLKPKKWKNENNIYMDTLQPLFINRDSSVKSIVTFLCQPIRHSIHLLLNSRGCQWSQAAQTYDVWIRAFRGHLVGIC